MQNKNYDLEVAELLSLEIKDLIQTSQGWFGALWLTEQVMKKFQPNIYAGKLLRGIELKVTRHVSHHSIKRLATDIFRRMTRIKEGYTYLPYYIPMVREGEAGFIRLELATDAELLARIHKWDIGIDSFIAYRDELYAYVQARKESRKQGNVITTQPNAPLH